MSSMARDKNVILSEGIKSLSGEDTCHE